MDDSTDELSYGSANTLYTPRRAQLRERDVMPPSPFVFVDADALAEKLASPYYLQPTVSDLPERVGMGAWNWTAKVRADQTRFQLRTGTDEYTCQTPTMAPAVIGAIAGGFLRGGVVGIVGGGALGLVASLLMGCRKTAVADREADMEAIVSTSPEPGSEVVVTPVPSIVDMEAPESMGAWNLSEIINPPAHENDTPLQRAAFRTVQIAVVIALLGLFVKWDMRRNRNRGRRHNGRRGRRRRRR